VILLRWLMLLGGSGLLFLLLWTTGLHNLYRDVVQQGWAILPFVALTGIENGFHALGSRWCLSRPHRAALPLWRLFLLYQTGYAFNLITPSAEIGGDVARGVVLEKYVPGPEAASAVIINKFTFSIARMAAAAALTGVTIGLFQLSWWEAWGLGLGAALTTLALLAFAFFQARGLLGAVLTWFARVGGARSRDWMALHVDELDRRLRAYYRENRRDLFAAILWDLAGFAVGIVQRTYMMRVLVGGAADGAPITLLMGAAVWAITTLLDMIFFFVTGGLGVLEGAHKLAFEAVGLPGGKGVALSVVTRLNQLVWILIGVGAYWVELTTGKAGRAATPAADERR
jgi:uncharacterized protein (TIRG00374 family)